MKLNVTVIRSKDGMIAYLDDYTGVVIQGNSIDELKVRMDSAIDNFVKYLNNSKQLLNYSEPLEISR